MNAARFGFVCSAAVVACVGSCAAQILPEPAAMPAAQAGAPAALLSPADLFDAAYDRWKALPHSAYATYVTHIEVVRKDRVEKRLNRIAYRRADNLCLTVGLPLDARDRPDAPSVTDRCLAPDYGFTFIPQRRPGRGGLLPLAVETQAPAAAEPATIGRVRVRARAYALVLAGEETVRGRPVAHLVLQPLRDPTKHILRDVWIDRATNGVVRLHGVAPLFGPVASIDFVADYDVAPQRETLVSVSGFAKAQLLLFKIGADFTFTQTDYAYPVALPAWYFEPGGYARHAHELSPEAPSSSTP